MNIQPVFHIRVLEVVITQIICKLCNASFIKFLTLKMITVFDILNEGNSSVELELKLYVKTSMQTS